MRNSTSLRRLVGFIERNNCITEKFATLKALENTERMPRSQDSRGIRVEYEQEKKHMLLHRDRSCHGETDVAEELHRGKLQRGKPTKYDGSTS